MSLCSNRHLLAFIFIPVIQKEMDIFRETVWNAHRVRSQKDAATPKGIPYHLYSFPDQYNADECGMAILLNMYVLVICADCTTKHLLLRRVSYVCNRRPASPLLSIYKLFFFSWWPTVKLCEKNGRERWRDWTIKIAFQYRDLQDRHVVALTNKL